MKYFSYGKGLLGLGLLLFVASGYWLFFTSGHIFTSQSATADSSLAQHNKYFATNPSFGELVIYFQDLSHEIGADKAFDVLIYGDLPSDVDTHLVGHAVGDILYEQKGLLGMSDCDSNLGYACTHSIVIQALLQQGPSVFDEINEICESMEVAGSYPLCFHGFGHGVLAYADYELPDAIEFCGKVGTEKYQSYEEVECLGGAIMEMKEGFHNPDLWEERGTKYLSDENPLLMCQSDYMPEEYKRMCYIYITPFIFDTVSGVGWPDPNKFAEAMSYCDVLDDPKHRDGCFGGFGKEYITLVHGRDVRLIEETTPKQHQTINEWCALASDMAGVRSCVRNAMYSTYKAGAIDHNVTVSLCNEAVNDEVRNDCLKSFIYNASSHHPNNEYANQFCLDMPEGYIGYCFDRFMDAIAE